MIVRITNPLAESIRRVQAIQQPGFDMEISSELGPLMTGA